MEEVKRRRVEFYLDQEEHDEIIKASRRVGLTKSQFSKMIVMTKVNQDMENTGKQ